MAQEMFDRFIIRLDDGMRDKIKKIASENRRSMNSQFVDLLHRGLDSLEVKDRDLASSKYDQRGGGDEASEIDRFINTISGLVAKLSAHESQAIGAYSALEARLDGVALLKNQATNSHSSHPSSVAQNMTEKEQRITQSLSRLGKHIQEIIDLRKRLIPFDVSNTLRWSKVGVDKFPTKNVDPLLYRELIESVKSNCDEIAFLIFKAEKIIKEDVNLILYGDGFERENNLSIKDTMPAASLIDSLVSDLAKRYVDSNPSKAGSPDVGFNFEKELPQRRNETPQRRNETLRQKI